MRASASSDRWSCPVVHQLPATARTCTAPTRIRRWPVIAAQLAGRTGLDRRAVRLGHGGARGGAGPGVVDLRPRPRPGSSARAERHCRTRPHGGSSLRGEAGIRTLTVSAPHITWPSDRDSAQGRAAHRQAGEPPARGGRPGGRRLGEATDRTHADQVSAEVTAKTAEQVFAVLGKLKGGAMKFGQALSVFEAAVPDEMAAPYREALTKLQTAAPPMPRPHHPPGARRAARRGVGEAVRGVRRRARRGGEHRPGAPGGVARRPRGGREGAVPGRGRGAARRPEAVAAVQPAVAGDHARHRREAAAGGAARPDDRGARLPRPRPTNQRTFAKAFDDDPHVLVPKVVASAPKVMVTRVDRRHAAVADHPRRHRASSATWRAGCLAEFHFSAPRARRACCTPTRTPATSCSATTAGCA